MSFSFLCNRCGGPFQADECRPECGRCAKARDHVEKTGAWSRMTTAKEILAAAHTVFGTRNHHLRRRPKHRSR